MEKSLCVLHTETLQATRTGLSPLCAAGERELRASTPSRYLTTVRPCSHTHTSDKCCGSVRGGMGMSFHEWETQTLPCLSLVWCCLCNFLVPSYNPPAHTDFSLSAPVEEPLSEKCATMGVLKQWALTLYGSSMTYSEVKDRQRYDLAGFSSCCLENLFCWMLVFSFLVD